MTLVFCGTANELEVSLEISKFHLEPMLTNRKVIQTISGQCFVYIFREDKEKIGVKRINEYFFNAGCLAFWK